MVDGIELQSQKLKIFISWSGTTSENVAKVWHSLIKECFDNSKPFMSQFDIELGTRGLNTIANELKGTVFGLVIVTKANQQSQWLHYESGALTKDFDNPLTKLIPVLVGFDSPGDLSGPLAAFQSTLLNYESVVRILTQIQKAIGDDLSDLSTALLRLERAWAAEYERKFAEASVDESEPVAKQNTDDSKLDELLQLTRSSFQGKNDFDSGWQLGAADQTSKIAQRFMNSQQIHGIREYHLGEGPFQNLVYVIKDGQPFTSDQLRNYETILSIIQNTAVRILTKTESQTSPLLEGHLIEKM
ncbi:toll/interleukin-1 receptor domain-containing protein [Rhodococcoides yunnanense]|jgi:hypothetical protein|uniref:toll/interleukin-1 receptor domain-containing protein n=1 Tax=Rhodococcoides yunnanense TaxID=278209 RepID=UPI0022B08F5C|nr:toll/interleukin-1 receptor domain-containing protein [Rhodococcus yunnanensis]MCZ4275310.1 toll/interleukin-1 receptor domain-containing protein [Rhodococcus yunnanensis]